MGLQLQHVFTGVAVGSREVQGQYMVNGCAVGIGNGQVCGFTRLEAAATQGLHQWAQALPLSRTMPTAPRPGAVAMAMMGASCCESMGGLSRKKPATLSDGGFSKA
jgi:hypothetical protein